MVLALILFANLATTINVTAQTASVITINADGSVSGTNLIQHDGNHYTLTASLNNISIIVECNNIVLDGGGFTLEGPGDWPTPAAINLTCSNVVVENFTIKNWEVGILGSWNGNVIAYNKVTNNERDIAIYADDYNLTGNNLASADYAVRIIGNHNNIFQNCIDNYGFAFWINSDFGNLIVDNDITYKNPLVFDSNYNDRIYHNNFYNLIGRYENATIESERQTLSGTTPAPWDNGFPSGGNYWSDYNTSYPNASAINNTTIGNTPYLVCSSPLIFDRYPLLTPVNTSETEPLPLSPLPSIQPTTKPTPSPSPPPTASPSPTPSPTTMPTTTESSLEPSPSQTAPTPEIQQSTPGLSENQAWFAVVTAVLIAAMIAAAAILKKNNKNRN